MLSALSKVWSSYADIKDYPLTIYGIDDETMNSAVELSKKHGLFISDAAHVAIMKSKGVANIATNDSDFERIEGIDIYKP